METIWSPPLIPQHQAECWSPPLSSSLHSNLLILELGDNVAVTVLGAGEALTRSLRREVAHGFSALPWGFVKPIDCDRVPSFLGVFLCGGGKNPQYFPYKAGGALLPSGEGGREGGAAPDQLESKAALRARLNLRTALFQRWKKFNFLSR